MEESNGWMKKTFIALIVVIVVVALSVTLFGGGNSEGTCEVSTEATPTVDLDEASPF